MTECSSLGSNETPAPLKSKLDGGSWSLWEKLAADRPDFGRPSVFADHINESRWLSFTTTFREPTFLDAVRNLTGNVAGEGGLITFPESNWLVSIVIPHQPHFINQPAGVSVLWSYGLHVDAPGNFVGKPMSAGSGREIMTEIVGHLRLDEAAPRILNSSICIPCMMPFITSQFLRRKSGDRPLVVPKHSKNLAFIGQFCELPYDVVFTVEYSIRSAQAAVYQLLGLKREPPPVYQGKSELRVLYHALLALHGIGLGVPCRDPIMGPIRPRLRNGLPEDRLAPDWPHAARTPWFACGYQSAALNVGNSGRPVA